MSINVVDVVGDDTFTIEAGEDLHAAIVGVRSRLVKVDFANVDMVAAPFLRASLLPFFLDETKRLYLVNLPTQAQIIVKQLQNLASKKMYFSRILV